MTSERRFEIRFGSAEYSLNMSELLSLAARVDAGIDALSSPTAPPLSEDEMAAVADEWKHNSVPARAVRELRELRARVAELEAERSRLPGLTATLDGYRHFAGLVSGLLDEFAAHESSTYDGAYARGALTRIRPALGLLDCGEPVRCTICVHPCGDLVTRKPGERACVRCVAKEVAALEAERDGLLAAAAYLSAERRDLELAIESHPSAIEGLEDHYKSLLECRRIGHDWDYRTDHHG